MFSFLLLLTGFFTAVNAQITVTGTVTSAEDGEPIPGVSVAVRGTTIGTVTNIDGHYSIEVPSEESVLRFSFVGMIRRDIMVGNQRTIDVEMEPDVVGLDEVVVTGYGVQRRRDLTGSVSSVRSQQIEGMPVESIQRAIQGRAAGVQVTAADGVPGGHVSVIVRGIGSFSSNSPIWIVDGVEIESGRLGYRSPSESILASLDFEDIESIDVLKDAAATAIYGARGANGVIVIETKRGRVEEETEFKFDIRRGFTEPLGMFPAMNGPQWAQWHYELYENRYGLGHAWTDFIVNTGVQRGWYELGADGKPDFTTSPHYDWQGKAYQRGNVLEARLEARGGGESTQFYTSLSHNMTEGHVINYEFARTSYRMNIDHQASDRLSFDAQATANISDQSSTRLGGAFSSPMWAFDIPPVEPIYTWQAEKAGIAHLGRDEDGLFNAPNSVYGALPTHMFYSARHDHNLIRNLKAIINLSATYNLSDNFIYRATVGVDYNHTDEEQWYDPRTGDGLSDNGTLRDYEHTAYAIQTTQTLSYNQIFGDVHEISGVAGFETWERTYRETSVRGVNFPDPQMNVLNAAGAVEWWAGTETERSTMGGFSRLNYTYDDRYLLTVTGRYDASSRFGADNRWGFFPAAAIGWRISGEPFMAGIDQIDNLMLRLSYGKAGSDAAGTYAALGLWRGGINYLGGTGLFPSQLPNRFLTWEESRTLNLAISLGAFNGRLNMDIDVFNRWTEELLLSRPLPPTTGWTSITENVGRTINQGIELSLNTVNIERENFRWLTNLNFTVVQQEILELLPGENFFNDRTMVGRAINDRNIPIWAGVNPADGRPMYYDKDYNLTYNPVYADRDWRGPEQPTMYGGLTNEFSFGNFGASVFLQYSGGNMRFRNDYRYSFCWPATSNQGEEVFTNRWTEPGQVTDVPKPMAGNAYHGAVRQPNYYSTRLLERVDYIRLKDVSISYAIPRTFTQRYGIESMRIFARSANLYTWTDFRGRDPEFTGDDWGTYPQGRTLTFGISTNF